MKRVYHLDLDEEIIKGARIALLPGDPFRVPRLAGKLDSFAREIAHKREYRTYLVSVDGKPVLVTSTGIGGPSASIAIDELAQLGVRVFIRVGTTGAIQRGIDVGDVIITTGAVRLDGASTHYAPIEYPAVADFKVVSALVQSAESRGIKFHIGITVSSDTFYPGQERYDSASGYVIRRFRGSLEEWKRLNVLNYEMESATVLTVCSALGLKGGCVTGVVVNRAESEYVGPSGLDAGERNAMDVAAKAVKILLQDSDLLGS